MFDPVNNIANWLRSLLTGWGLPSGLIVFILTFLGVLTVASVVLLLDILLVWVERKVVARFQDRLGPNRVGPFGLIQPIADVIKLIIKEDIFPEGGDKFVFNLAPILAFFTVLLLWAVIPFAPTWLGADVNVGVLYIVAIGGLATLGIIMAGWASNNKYALLGAFRTVAMVLSYEVPMVIALLVPVILARSMGIGTIVESQSVWYVVMAPLAALLFLVTSIAELGRAPFDLTEAESEIVAGYHIEYTGMKFGLFYAGELLHALTVSALFSTLFLGGWRGPFVQEVPVLGVIYLFVKTFLAYFVIMWIRYSFPRLRIDQMMDFCWKFLTPLGLALLIVTAILDKAIMGTNALLTETNTTARVLIHLGANIVIALITVQVLRVVARRVRLEFEQRPVAASQFADIKEPVGQE